MQSGSPGRCPVFPAPFSPTWKVEQRSRLHVDARGAQDGRGWGHPKMAEPPGLWRGPGLAVRCLVCSQHSPRLTPQPWA